MKRSPLLVASFFSLALVACGASIDPAMRASIDTRVAALKPQPKSYPSPTQAVPMPLEPGQWARFKLVTNGQPGFATYKVLAKEGAAHWVEVVQEQYSGRSVIKMLVDFGDRTDPKKVEIKKVTVKMRDQSPMEYQPPLLNLVQGTYRAVAENMVVHWEGLPKETRTVPAGTFADCFKGNTEVAFFGTTHTAVSWSHTAVPINGLVHSEGGDGSQIDLVDFGSTGATSEL